MFSKELIIMAYKERINPKTGKKEYKVRYYFMKEGKKRDSETAWFTSLEKAEKEAKKQKEEKEKADRDIFLQRRDKKLVTAYEEFVEYLKELADREESNTNRKEHNMGMAIFNNHMPVEVQNTKIKDITSNTFKRWLDYMNKKESLGGGYIRLCRLNLIKFNAWLNQNGYYLDGEDSIEEMMDLAIRKVKIKNSLVNNRERNGERHIVTSSEILKITRYYIDKEYGLGDFRNFYFYTLFYVFFFSGVRVEELTGLQWKFIDLRESRRSISIKNAISKMEKVEHALERTRKGQYRTKNPTSIRTIPIFDFYYELLKDYKESFRYQYNLKKEEIEECYVFPNIDQNNPYKYMRSESTLRELKKVLNAVGIDNTDLQMFRHSCAMFLILSPPEGLGFTEERVMDYFGHQDTKMLKRVYARLSEKEKADRMRKTFSDIYNPTETDDKTEEEKKKQELINRFKGGNEESKIKARKYRIHNQIRKAMLEGKVKYYYNVKDKGIIDDYIKDNGNTIEFIEE